jgi:hypothetical protein
MNRLILALLLLAGASLSSSLAQAPAQPQIVGEIPNTGRAPRQPNGAGRLDLRVFDESGKPIQGAYAFLSSRLPGDLLAESWNTTDERGVAVLPPTRMGKLVLTVKAKGYRNLRMMPEASAFAQPVRVTLRRK